MFRKHSPLLISRTRSSAPVFALVITTYGQRDDARIGTQVPFSVTSGTAGKNNRRVSDLLSTILDTLAPQSSIRQSRPIPLPAASNPPAPFGGNVSSSLFLGSIGSLNLLTLFFFVVFMTLVPFTFLPSELTMVVVAPCY